jgi:hypothetical protein
MQVSSGTVTRALAALALATALALAASAGAQASPKSTLSLKGPSVNVFNTPFVYKASGNARGSANYIYGWEVAYSPSCASTYKGESARPGKAVFLSRTVSKNKHFSLTIPFFARNTEKHRFCAYLVSKGSGATLARAEASWTNVPAGAPPGGKLQPTPVGSGECQAKKYPDLAAYAQIATSGGASCAQAESVAAGADAAKGAPYSRAGFSCTSLTEGAGSTWASAWTGTYYAYNCASGGQQLAFNWGAQYAYVPASTLPTISPTA